MSLNIIICLLPFSWYWSNHYGKVGFAYRYGCPATNKNKPSVKDMKYSFNIFQEHEVKHFHWRVSNHPPITTIVVSLLWILTMDRHYSSTSLISFHLVCEKPMCSNGYNHSHFSNKEIFSGLRTIKTSWNSAMANPVDQLWKLLLNPMVYCFNSQKKGQFVVLNTVEVPPQKHHPQELSS